MIAKKVGDGSFFESASDASSSLLDAGDGERVLDDLDEAHFIAGGNGPVRGEAKIKTSFNPNPFHKRDHLKRELILSEIVAVLEHEWQRLSRRIKVFEDKPKRNFGRAHMFTLITDQSFCHSSWIDG